MFKFTLSLMMLIISSLTFANTDRYECLLSHKKDRKEFRELKLRNSHHDKLNVTFQECSLTRNNANFDICKLGQNTLVIAIDPTKSVLLTKRGKAIELSCEEKDNGNGTPDTDGGDDDEEEEQEQEQQEQQESEPGHGGSNIRMRGIRINDSIR